MKSSPASERSTFAGTWFNGRALIVRILHERMDYIRHFHL